MKGEALCATIIARWDFLKPTDMTLEKVETQRGLSWEEHSSMHLHLKVWSCIGYKISKSLWFSNCEEKARVEGVEAGLFADGTFWKLTLEFKGVQRMEFKGVSNASLSTLAQLQQKIKSRFFLFPQLQTVKCIYQYIDYCNDIVLLLAIC